MENLKYSHYGLYKAIANFCFYFSLLGLVGMIVVMFSSFHRYSPNVELPFNKGKVGYFSYTNNGLENCYLKLNNVFDFRGLNINGKEVAINFTTDGKKYSAYYSSMSRMLRISIDIPLAERIKKLMFPLYIFSYLLALTVLYLVRKILFSLKDGTPFTLKNARFISIIALILVLLPLIRMIAENLIEGYLSSKFNVTFGNTIGPDETDMTCLFGGLIFAILSYVIKQGVIMRDEQDLTI